MASLTVRNIDESIKAGLRMSAAEHGRSMEEEVRQILKQFLLRKRSSAGIGSGISRRFAVIGGLDLPDVQRSNPRRPPTFFSDDAQ
jgi:plasmid stability protein